MNILHISSQKNIRGGERQVQLLIHGLKNKGHKNYLICHKLGKIRDLTKDDVEAIFSHRKGIFRLFKYTQLLSKICQKHNIDVIHAHDSYGHTMAYASHKLNKKLPTTIVTRNLALPIKRRSVRKYNHPGISKIICVSNAVKKALAPKIKNDNRLLVIPAGIKLPDASLRQPPTPPYTILYVAAFTEEKGHRIFFDMVRKMNDSVYQFVLVGQGPLLQKYKDEFGSMSNVEFAGFANDVAPYYHRADILVHTATQEALGLSILEGMSYGLPVVAHRIGGIPEVVIPGENGALHTLGDISGMIGAIKSICQDEHTYQKYSRNSIEHAKKFDIDFTINAIEALYKRQVVR